MLLEEKFKPYRDFQYLVSNYGTVINFKTGRVKQLSEDTYGYLVTTLFKNGKRKQFKVHRLVAELFVDGYFEKLVVNHKDGNKKNNCYLNLEWMTAKENTIHAIENNFHTNKLSFKDVKKIKEICVPFDNNFGVVALAKQYEVDPMTISRVINNRTWKASLND